jgi:hypothetical protein
MHNRVWLLLVILAFGTASAFLSDTCFLLIDSAGTMQYVNASKTEPAKVTVTSLALPTQCPEVLSSAFDGVNTIYVTCANSADGNFTKVYTFDLSGSW